MTHEVYRNIQRLRDESIYVVIESDTTNLGPAERPATVIPKGGEYGIMVDAGQGLFCPEWGEDLEHLPYYKVEHVKCYRAAPGGNLQARRMVKGTKCFVLPPEVFMKVVREGTTEEELLKKILQRDQHRE